MTDADKTRLDTLWSLHDSEETSAIDTKWVIDLLNRYVAVAKAASSHINALNAYENCPCSSHDKKVQATDNAWVAAMRNAGKTP